MTKVSRGGLPGDHDPELSRMIEDARKTDLDDWREYQLSLSKSEHRERVIALRNMRMTKRFIQHEAPKFDSLPLSELEASNHLRSLINQASQIEHFSFETWREVRRIKLATFISLGLAALNICLLVILILMR
jgi:hypothetical protein